jgi:hypothetical protein
MQLNREIVQEKQSESIFPTHATKLEVYEKVRQALNTLWAQGRIRVGDTINDRWIIPLE